MKMELRLGQERGDMFSWPQEALGTPPEGLLPVAFKEEQENPRESWGHGDSNIQQVPKYGSSGVKVASLPNSLPQIRRLLKNRRLTHKQEQQEACGQWEEDSVGAGQEVLVDGVLAVNEWLVPRARALVSTAQLTQL